MQVRCSTFPKNSPLLVLFLVSHLACCSGDRTLWGHDLDEVRRRLRAADFSFLRQTDWAKADLAELARLGEGAAFYFHHIFKEQGLPEQADRALRQEWNHGQGIWKEAAGLAWLEELARREEHALVEREAGRFIAELPGSIFLPRVKRLLLEALYRQERDEEALALLGALPGEPELRMMRAVASCRRELPGWEGLFTALFLQERSSALHLRAYTFLQQADRLSRFPKDLGSLFAARALLYEWGPARALDSLEEQVARLAPSQLESSPLIGELGMAYFAAGRLDRGARFLVAQADRLAPLGQMEALELAGRLYRKHGSLEQAEALLRGVIEKTADPVQRDRAIWFVLDIRRRKGFEPAIADIGRLAPLWHDPAYFFDILNDGITVLAERQDWPAVERLYRQIEGIGPPQVLARICYLLGRVALGRQAGPEAAAGAELLRRARRLQPSGYYGMLAATLLGEPLAAWPPRNAGGADAAGPGAGGNGAGPASTPAPPPADSPGGGREGGSGRGPLEDPRLELIRGFFRFGLPLHGYRMVQQASPAVPADEAIAFARLLNEGGHYLESIRLMYRLPAETSAAAGEPIDPDGEGGPPLAPLTSLAGPSAPLGMQTPPPGAGMQTPAGGPMEPRNLQLMYPRAFREPIEALAGRIGLADPLLFALVREESLFDPGIVSRAGAVGLTQLMPATARDIAGRLKIQDPDLRDPELNLQLGGRHLGWLLERLQDVPKALMAYNAGLGRLRDWEEKLPDLPADLFVEAVPYEETRHYLRKILVSAVYYGYLYHSRSPVETVRAFYPRLSPESLKAAEGGGR